MVELHRFRLVSHCPHPTLCDHHHNSSEYFSVVGLWGNPHGQTVETVSCCFSRYT